MFGCPLNTISSKRQGHCWGKFLQCQGLSEWLWLQPLQRKADPPCKYQLCTGRQCQTLYLSVGFANRAAVIRAIASTSTAFNRLSTLAYSECVFNSSAANHHDASDLTCSSSGGNWGPHWQQLSHVSVKYLWRICMYSLLFAVFVFWWPHFFWRTTQRD